MNADPCLDRQCFAGAWQVEPLAAIVPDLLSGLARAGQLRPSFHSGSKPAYLARRLTQTFGLIVGMVRRRIYCSSRRRNHMDRKSYLKELVKELGSDSNQIELLQS